MVREIVNINFHYSSHSYGFVNLRVCYLGFFQLVICPVNICVCYLLFFQLVLYITMINMLSHSRLQSTRVGGQTN